MANTIITEVTRTVNLSTGAVQILEPIANQFKDLHPTSLVDTKGVIFPDYTFRHLKNLHSDSRTFLNRHLGICQL